jgi:hypothetical protein
MFIIYALPRSRTAWLARFLSYRDWHCGHDASKYFRSFDDVKSWFSQPNTGMAETSLAPYWRLVQKHAPDIKVAVIRRPVGAVVESCRNAGFPASRENLRRILEQHDRKLDQIEKRLKPLVLSFDELNEHRACESLFEHCLPYKFDQSWWASLRGQNIQIDVPALLRYCGSHLPQIQKMASMAKQAMLSDLAVCPVNVAGLTIAEESFDDFFRDSQALFKEHLVSVGRAPEELAAFNIPLFQTLNQHGMLQVLTARCNGRVVGYLLSSLSPALHCQDLVGYHATFFVSKDAPGAGLKLQRESIRRLKEKGATEIYFRAGPRGDGPRTSLLYKRCGAEPDGEFYRLSF